MAKQAQGQDLGGGLSALVEPGAGGTRITLAGALTERADLSPLLKVGAALAIDLAGVKSINSLGVRGWCMFLRNAESAGLSVVCDRVSTPMIQQVSMISNFFGTKSKVRSLFVPYLCPRCNADDLQLVEVGAGGAIEVQSSKPCPKCKSEMDLDEPPEMYEAISAELAGR